jgi:hypothetical protein
MTDSQDEKFPSPTALQIAATERTMDWIEAQADEWAEEVNLTAMIKNIAAAAKLNTGVPADMRNKFAARCEANMDALCRQIFLEAYVRCIDSAKQHFESFRAAP